MPFNLLYIYLTIMIKKRISNKYIILFLEFLKNVLCGNYNILIHFKSTIVRN